MKWSRWAKVAVMGGGIGRAAEYVGRRDRPGGRWIGSVPDRLFLDGSDVVPMTVDRSVSTDFLLLGAVGLLGLVGWPPRVATRGRVAGQAR